MYLNSIHVPTLKYMFVSFFVEHMASREQTRKFLNQLHKSQLKNFQQFRLQVNLQ
jgi:hypothetical protein